MSLPIPIDPDALRVQAEACEYAALILQDRADELRGQARKLEASKIVSEAFGALPSLQPVKTPLTPPRPIPGLATPIPDGL